MNSIHPHPFYFSILHRFPAAGIVVDVAVVSQMDASKCYAAEHDPPSAAFTCHFKNLPLLDDRSKIGSASNFSI